MKKISLFLLFCVLVSGMKFDTKIVYSFASESTYAKVLSECNLYKTQSLNDELSNIYFIIPKTYFVKILSDDLSNCYKVQYDKYVGYVKTSSVEIVNFIPKVKTLSGVTCDIKTSSGTQIWNSPTTESKILTTINAGTKNINYIATTHGSIPSGGTNDVWFYVMFTPAENSTNVYEGYIYANNTTNLSKILPNNEVEINLTQDNEKQTTTGVSTGLKTVLIALISIPLILFFALALYKSIKIISKNTNKKKNCKKEIDEYCGENIDKKQNFSHKKLKSEINYMSKNSFVKIPNNKFSNEKYYPEFPTYDEDDIL